MTEARACHAMYPNGQHRSSTHAMRVLAVALWICPLVASAQSVDKSDVASPEVEAQVKEQVIVGTAAYRKRKYDDAWTALNAAWLLKQSGAISAMLAEVETKLGRYDQAATHWAYAKEHLPADSRDAFKQASNGLDECTKLVGTLDISLKPTQADVIIDRKLVEVKDTAMHAWVMPGTHTILGVVDGSKFSMPETFDILPGETKHIDIDVTEAPRAKAPRPPLSPTPPPPLPFLAKQDEPRRNSTDGRTAVVVSGAGLTLVALGFGTWFGVHRSSLKDEIEKLQADTDRIQKSTSTRTACAPDATNPPSTCTALRAAIADYNSNTRFANYSFAVSAGLGIATIAAYLLWPTDSKASQSGAQRIVIAPWLTQQSKGMDLQLRF